MTDDAARYLPASDGDSVALAVNGCRALAAAGQADMVWGHPSVRDPQGRGAWMKASGWGFEEIDASRIVLVSPDGAVVAGDGLRHIEYPIHTEVMAARPDVGAVVHTHSAAACQFAALDVPLRPLDHAGSLVCYPDIPRFGLTGGLIKHRDLGRAVAEALGDANAMLLPQHGIVTAGPDIPTAIMTAVLLDRACRTQLTAMAAGPLRVWGSEADTIAKRADVWAPSQIRAGYEYLLRQAPPGPGPASGWTPRPSTPEVRPV
ncbi:MAG TPA: class II aldolase/adducin family protein [Trebonia sp.]